MARWREAVIDVRDAPDSRLWPRDRLTTIGVSLGLMFWSFLQHPGAATFDTKFDLTQDPGPFMLRSLHLWNQQSNFGELQNQAYGYLFPQGLFHLLGEWAGLPDWVVQRLWSGLLLVVAYDGARRLMRALSGDGARPWPSQVAGLAYATAPRLLGLSGVLSAEVLPTAVVVWVVLPIVLAQRGRLSPRTGGLLSGVAVLFMGGVNAVENLAALPLPFFVVLSTIATVRGRRLAGWWALGTSAAAVWWMAPLLVLGKYSPPFLDYIETSSAVVNPLGWANSVRGADHWLAYIYVGGRPWWPGAYQLAYSPHLVLATAAVAALGIAGLGLRTMPLRRALIASLLLGLVCLTVARQGTLAAPTQGLVQYLLDGPLSMLRNVHKVDPLVRVPLALGLGHLLERVLRRLEPEGESAGLAPVRAAWLRPVALASTLLLILVAAQPLVTGSLRRPGWREVPQAWSEATAYLGRHADGARDGAGGLRLARDHEVDVELPLAPGVEVLLAAHPRRDAPRAERTGLERRDDVRLVARRAGDEEVGDADAGAQEGRARRAVAGHREDVEAVREPVEPVRVEVDDGDVVLVVERLGDRAAHLPRSDDQHLHGAARIAERRGRT